MQFAVIYTYIKYIKYIIIIITIVIIIIIIILIDSKYNMCVLAIN